MKHSLNIGIVPAFALLLCGVLLVSGRSFAGFDGDIVRYSVVKNAPGERDMSALVVTVHTWRERTSDRALDYLWGMTLPSEERIITSFLRSMASPYLTDPGDYVIFDVNLIDFNLNVVFDEGKIFHSFSEIPFLASALAQGVLKKTLLDRYDIQVNGGSLAFVNTALVSRSRYYARPDSEAWNPEMAWIKTENSLVLSDSETIRLQGLVHKLTEPNFFDKVCSKIFTQSLDF